ncbi:MAG: cupin domain-containing protein [Gemmatimonadetes bacterium]|jgi:quercetin dioxygenase-like cupin family protein|nr:cupin domain-containing protein [Gemmatimonadota bacterium]
MSHHLLAAAAVAVGLVVSATAAFAQDEPMARHDATPAMHDVAEADLAWDDLDVPGFLPGMKIAPIHGDPSVADEQYTLRLALPDGYKFPPHWHPRAENLTVLEGTFLLAMGKKFDDSKLKSYVPGDYLFIAGESPHYGLVKGRTVLQLHGIGPFDILVVEGQGMSP